MGHANKGVYAKITPDELISAAHAGQYRCLHRGRPLPGHDQDEPVMQAMYEEVKPDLEQA